MPRLIGAEIILALLLSRNREISFKELRQLRQKIEEEIPELTVDISVPSVVWVLDHYPYLFSTREDKITRAENSESFFASNFIKSEFLSFLPLDADLEKLSELVKAA